MTEDYPKTVLEFERRFATDAACRAYLMALRWPEGFVCPRCGGRKAWPTVHERWGCNGCWDWVATSRPGVGYTSCAERWCDQGGNGWAGKWRWMKRMSGVWPRGHGAEAARRKPWSPLPPKRMAKALGVLGWRGSLTPPPRVCARLWRPVWLL